MRTNDLIQTLARQAGPVKPIDRPGVRFVRWASFAFLSIALGAVVLGLRADLAVVWFRPGFVLQVVLVLGTAAAAAWSALALSVPGAGNARMRRVLEAILAAWILWLVWRLVSTGDLEAGSGLKCARNILLLGLAPGALLYLMIGRAAPLRLEDVGWLAGLGLSAFAEAGTRLLCRNEHPLHTLLWHGLPVAFLAYAGILFGRSLLGERWRTSAKQ